MKKITNDAMDSLSVVWEPTTVCNYSCWYCDPALHDGKYKWPDLDIVLEFFYQLSEKYRVIHLDMVGGEPTLWPQLTQFMEKKPKNVLALVSTNGSRTLRWWENKWPFIEGTCISFHPDSADPDHIFNLVSLLMDPKFPKKFVQVNILAYESNYEKSVYLFDKLDQSGFPIDCRIKVVDARYKDDERIQSSRKNQTIIDIITNKQFYRSNHLASIGKPTKLFVDDQQVSFNEMFTWKFNKVSNFKGWKCSAGKSRLSIEANGDIFRGSCKNGGKVGNLFIDTSINLTYTICEQDLCGCGDELILEKYKF